MALRLIEVVLPESEAATFGELVDMEPVGGPWFQTLDDHLRCVRVVLDAEASGGVVDAIDSRYGHVAGYHLLILPVHAALPRPPEREEGKQHPAARAPTFGGKGGGLSREELLTEVKDMARPTKIFVATVALSTAVVSIGLLRDNTAAIIGAMVMAPLLGPNVALELGTTLADTSLLRYGLHSTLVGFTVALAITTVLGGVIGLETPTPEMVARTVVHFSDIILALAAGSAGALAITTGVPVALVGVMVAVALLPPTAVVGLMLGRGAPAAAGGAALLLLVNVLCVNLAAMVTFRIQGIRPWRWWEADKARRASRLAVWIGVTLLVALGVLLLLSAQDPLPTP